MLSSTASASAGGAGAASSSSKRNSAMADKVEQSILSCQLLDKDSKKAMFELLAYFEGEIQARDLAITALKSECLKHLLTSASISSPHPLEPLISLHRDYGHVGGGGTKALLEHAEDSPHVQLQCLKNVSSKQRMALRKMEAYLRASEEQRTQLEEELHTTERDLKEAKSRAEEAEKAAAEVAKPAADGIDGAAAGELTKEVESLSEKLKMEQKQKMELVVLLLSDRKKLAALYLEEKKRSDELARLLRDEQGKTRKMAGELEEESKRSLAMETEVEQYIRQLAAQREETKKILLEENHKNLELEEALRRSRQESEHLRKQLAEAHRVAMSQASSSMPPPPPVSTAPSSSSGSGLGSGGSAQYGRNSASGQANYVATQEHFVTGASKSVSKGTLKAVDDKTRMDNPEYIRGSNRSSLGRSGKLTSSGSQSIGGSTSKTDYYTANSSSSGKSENTNTVRKMVPGAAKGLPPPVPPNKPALSVYKSGGGQMMSYSVTKQAIQD